MKSRRDRDPLAPIENVVQFILLTFTVFLVVFGAIAVVNLVRVGDSGGFSFAGFGDRYVFLDDVTNAPSFTSGERPSQGIDGLDRDRATDDARSWSVCIDDPTDVQRVAGSVGPISGLLALFGALLLTRSAIRDARRGGLFTASAARRVRFLGCLMLVTSLTVPLVESLGTSWVMSQVVADWDWGIYGPGILFSAPFSALAIVVSIGIITVARILERAVPLQEEVDATV